MTAGEATERFFDADRHFRKGEYAEALEILSEVDRHFPGRHRVLYPKARCLSELQRFDEALAICERLIEDHAYDRAARLKERILRRQQDDDQDFDTDDFMEVDDVEDVMMDEALGTHSAGSYITRDAKLSELKYVPKDPEDEMAAPPPAEDRYIEIPEDDDALYTPGSQILEQRHPGKSERPQEYSAEPVEAHPEDEVPFTESPKPSHPAIVGPDQWAEDPSLGPMNVTNSEEAEEEEFPVSDEPSFDEDDDGDEDKPGPRFKLKPIRLLLLIGIVAAMATGYLDYWLGGGLIVGYFVLKFITGRALRKAFEAPFKMKGKALEGATIEVHSVEHHGARPDDADAEDTRATTTYVIEVTIHAPAPQGNFTHWEPGELMLADARTPIRSLDDLDTAFGLDMIWIEGDGTFVEDEGAKVTGPQKLRIRAHLDPTIPTYQFAYYNQAFGEIPLP